MFFRVEFESLKNHIPRALAARDTVPGSWASTDGFAGYVAQEKLDGVFVLWDGSRLYTKTGLPVPHDRLRDWLPPFPFVGELCTGSISHLPWVHLGNGCLPITTGMLRSSENNFLSAR